MVQNLCFTYCKFIALTTHVLNQDGQMQLTTTGYFEAVSTVCFLYTERNVCVQLFEKTVTDVTGSNVFTFLTSQRAVVYDEVHGDGRLGDLLERDRYRIFRITDRITDMDISDTGDRYDGTNLCFFYFYFI